MNPRFADLCIVPGSYYRRWLSPLSREPRLLFGGRFCLRVQILGQLIVSTGSNGDSARHRDDPAVASNQKRFLDV